MAWFGGKVSLGGFPDLAGAINKLQESVKNIEKIFDTALGFEEKSESSSNEASGLWSSDRKALFDPIMAFMGHKSEESDVESSGKLESSQIPPKVEEKEEAKTDRSLHSPDKTTVEEDKQAARLEKDNEHSEAGERADTAISDACKAESESKPVFSKAKPSESTIQNVELSDSLDNKQEKESSEVVPSEDSDSKEAKLDTAEVDQVEDAEPVLVESIYALDILGTRDEQKTQTEEILEKGSPVKAEDSSDSQAGSGGGPDEPAPSSSNTVSVEETNTAWEFSLPKVLPSYEAQGTVSESVFLESDANTKRIEVDQQTNDSETTAKEDLRLSSATTLSDSADSMHELEKVKMEMKMMESALQGAARQAQSKADEIAKLMDENEQLKAVIEDLKLKVWNRENPMKQKLSLCQRNIVKGF